jgi:hypothetical protein
MGDAESARAGAGRNSRLTIAGRELAGLDDGALEELLAESVPKEMG